MMKLILVTVALLTLTGCLKTRSELTDGRSQQEVQQQQVAAARELKQQEVDDQIRSLVGRVEVLENQVKEVAAQSYKGPTEEETKAQAEKFALIEQALEKLDLQMVALRNEVQVYAKSAAKTAAKPAPKKKGNFSMAEEAFDKKNWKEAIVGYEKYRELNPKGRKYGDSTYKIGVSFQELGMDDAAKSFYLEVLKKYPKTDLAKKAKYRLSKLKK